MVKMLDMQSPCRWPESWVGHYQLVTTYMGEFLWTRKPSR